MGSNFRSSNRDVENALELEMGFARSTQVHTAKRIIISRAKRGNSVEKIFMDGPLAVFLWEQQ